MRTIYGVLFTLALALPAAAQEPGDSIPEDAPRSAPVPVWVIVEDVENEAGAHLVRAAVMWEDWRHGFRFSVEVLPGDLVVSVPKHEGVISLETCDYTSALMAHGSEGYQPFERADTDCLAPPVEYMAAISVEHLGAPMACTEADRADGIEDPTLRIFGCYWAQDPTGG
ncbi:MAG: hypothetical protein F4086_11445 [Gemmatimonadetes bacterium]|nr:hypothetical protein [Gammaproteobacteria bacterium]MYE92966.1 hypothetical protein [Gemmatimonadota bacterium]MYJ10919.1 hypothetical protein [Gemmatimonadota bacterium]